MDKERWTPSNQVAQAFAIAESSHRGVPDKGGRPYIGHVLRVAGEVALTANPQIVDAAVAAALLHDVVEDDPAISIDDLRGDGFSEEVLEAVMLVTKPPGLAKGDDDALRAYLGAIKGNDLALAVKRADIKDNSDERRLGMVLNDAKRDELRRKYERYLVILAED